MIPERFYCSPTATVPNSRLPALLYRNVLTDAEDEMSVTAQIERNGWTHRVGFNAIAWRTPVAHSCPLPHIPNAVVV